MACSPTPWGSLTHARDYGEIETTHPPGGGGVRGYPRPATASKNDVYSRIVGGTHHKADLNHAVFDLASQVGLVGIVHDTANSADPNEMAVGGVANRTIYTAGYFPRALAAVVAPLIGSGGAANAAVIETI
jgi:hypothetical protein